MSIRDFFRRSRRAFDAAFPAAGGGDDNPLSVPLAGDSLKINAVFACVNIISNAIASLPFDLYRRTDNGREKAVNHRLYNLTKYPSADIPGYNFREALVVNLLIFGNAYIELVRVGGRVRELNLIPSKYVTVNTASDGTVSYVVTYKGGSRRVEFGDESIMHIAGKSFNGRVGMSPVEKCMESIVLARALEHFGVAYFERGARPSGFLKTARKLSEEAVARLKTSFADNYMGSKNSGKMIVLEDGMEYAPAQNGNSDSQFLEARRFQIEEIARIFAVPLFLLQSTEKSTSWGSGLEQLNISFVQTCLSNWLKRIEEAFNFFLLTDAEKRQYYFEFNVDGLLRGDQKSRFDAYHEAIMDGWLSPNEVRAKENLPDIPGGDVYFIPVNMAGYAGPDKGELTDAELTDGGEK